MYDKYIVRDSDKLRRIEEALLATYFKKYDQNYLTSEDGKQDIEANVYKRYNIALKHVVPWVAQCIDLKGKKLLEIGSGTGSSTAAFAHFVEKIDGYDIEEGSLSGAQARLQIMEVENTILHLVKPEDLASTLKKNHADGVDIILLFAVLEHQTIQERHETIALSWELLNQDGLLVVADTPNLLHWMDLHTSQLPFQHLLPTELYAEYTNRSPRKLFRDEFTDFSSLSLEKLETKITRWARGVSFHDFELALSREHGKYLVANGFEQDILRWVDVSLEEELLRHFFKVKKLDIPLAFSRSVLNFIYKKNEEIKTVLPSPPGEGFIIDIFSYREQEHENDWLKKELAGAQEQLYDTGELEHANNWLKKELADAQKQSRDINLLNNRLHEELAGAQEQLKDINLLNNRLHEELKHIITSKSWRFINRSAVIYRKMKTLLMNFGR